MYKQLMSDIGYLIFGTIICTDLMFEGIAYFWVLEPGETSRCVMKLFFLIPCNNSEVTSIWYKSLLLTTFSPSLLIGLGSLKDFNPALSQISSPV